MKSKRSSHVVRRPTILKAAFGVALLVGVLFAHSPLAHAATVWNVTPTSACTLADAITASNTAATSGSCAAGTGGTGTLNIGAGFYTLGASLPAITGNVLNIVGAGVGTTYIDGQNQYSVIDGSSGNLVGVSNLSIDHAGGGFAIYAYNSTVINNVVIENSTVAGGISMGGTVGGTLTNASIINGSANAYALDIGVAGGTDTVNNITVASNRNGVYVNANATSTVNITNATIAANTGSGGILFQNSSGSTTVNLKNSILANTTNCTGTITSQGHNITSDNSCGFVGTSNLISTNPGLAILQPVNGTYVLPITYTSPAYDSGDATGAPSTDQRGVPRPQCGGIDIGAYEATGCTPVQSSSGGTSGAGSSGSS
jgi:hypothetical protein